MDCLEPCGVAFTLSWTKKLYRFLRINFFLRYRLIGEYKNASRNQMNSFTPPRLPRVSYRVLYDLLNTVTMPLDWNDISK